MDLQLVPAAAEPVCSLVAAPVFFAASSAGAVDLPVPSAFAGLSAVHVQPAFALCVVPPEHLALPVGRPVSALCAARGPDPAVVEFPSGSVAELPSDSVAQ